MRLKVLIVPFLIVMVLVLLIGYIQPDIEAMQAKKLELAIKAGQVSDMETVIGNIDMLNGSLDAQKESVQFVMRYFPKTMDQGNVIDALNFLALQSGLSVLGMELKEPPRTSASSDAATAGNGSGSVGVVPPFQPPAARTYAVSVKVNGSYENIRSFFDQVSHMDRFHKLKSLAISAGELEKEVSSTGGATIAGLVGTFQADFDYLPEKSAGSALGNPVFQSSQLDFSVVGRVLDRITNAVPELGTPLSGKPNPFQ